MAVLDLVACPICQARDSLVRQTTQLESRTHVTYECLQCGTLLAWLGDDMWLEADRWSFQRVGLSERADLLYRSMTAAELRDLAGEQPPYTASPGQEADQAIPPPVWIEMAPGGEEVLEEALPEELEEAQPLAEQGPQPEVIAGVAVAGGSVLASQGARQQTEPEQEPPLEAGAGAAVAAAAALSQVEAQPDAPQPAGEQGTPKDREEPAAEAAVQQAPGLGASEAAAQDETPASHDAPGGEPSPASSRAQRRSRGSPFLVISVGLVLLCLICSAAAMVIYSMYQKLPAGIGPATNPPAGEVVPTETPIPTDTPFPTATASPMPAETPPEAEGGVEFQGVTDYLSSTGSHYLVGEVLNETADTLRFVEVLATFYDADGQLVGTGSTFTELSIIEPGSTAPFKMTTLNPPAVGRYDLRVDYSTTTQPAIRLEVTGHSGSAAESGWYHVTGEVRNPHGFAVKFPEIVATYYNATHEVVRVEVDFAEVDPLEPGQASAFEVVLTDPPADLQHYTLQTEAVQQ